MFEWTYMDDKTPDSDFDQDDKTICAKTYLVSERRTGWADGEVYVGDLVENLVWVRGTGWVFPRKKDGIKYDVYAWARWPEPAEYKPHEGKYGREDGSRRRDR